MDDARTGLRAVFAATMTACSVSAGQPQLPRGAERVDPGLGDVGALPGVSRADLFKDLRQERGFGTVYRLDVRPPMGTPGAPSTMYMRMDGGVTAVFPQSVYFDSSLSPGVPPGTTFYIGALPGSFGSAPTPPPRSATYVDTRVDLRARPAVASSGEAEGGETLAERPSIWDDEAYRQRVVARLMQRAAESGR